LGKPELVDPGRRELLRLVLSSLSRSALFSRAAQKHFYNRYKNIASSSVVTVVSEVDGDAHNSQQRMWTSTSVHHVSILWRESVHFRIFFARALWGTNQAHKRFRSFMED